MPTRSIRFRKPSRLLRGVKARTSTCHPFLTACYHFDGRGPGGSYKRRCPAPRQTDANDPGADLADPAVSQCTSYTVGVSKCVSLYDSSFAIQQPMMRRVP